jgi:hypothetical protein
VEDTADEVHSVGHRAFVGGDGPFWEKISKLQFEFVRAQGLAPSDVFIDVACGALRGGMRFIDYLEPGHYLGLDKHIELVIYGVASELTLEKFRLKRPRFAISDRFEFEKFHERPSFGIAQSLFTHLIADDIRLCLANLRKIAAPGCRFFATYFQAEKAMNNPAVSHSHGGFAFTIAEMESFGRDTGWQPHHIGDWGHPRNQRMMEYRNGSG